ncbi:MAG: hypothetical protein JNK85_23365 [Verrucomicrobiales bacterium]|nr:hypothetical protein [Verrucomicrobiales bacterium]
MTRDTNNCGFILDHHQLEPPLEHMTTVAMRRIASASVRGAGFFDNSENA